jgi:hypothetical protein
VHQEPLEWIVPSPGAPRYALAEFRKVAEAAVDEVTARVDAGRQNGDLKQVNRQYKIYRQQQIARAEKAIPYAKFIDRFTMSLLRGAAVNSAAV